MNKFLFKLTKFILFIGDIGLLYASLWITVLIRYQDKFNNNVWNLHWQAFTTLFIIWLIIFYAFNLYDKPAGKSNIDFFNNYLKAIIFNFSLGILYFYAFSPKTNLAPKTILVLLIIIFSLFFLLWRKIISKFFKSKLLYRNLLFIGYEPLIKELLPKKESNQRFGFIYKGIVTDKVINDELGLKQYQLDQLEETIKKEKINLLVVNEPENQQITNLLFGALKLRINFVSLTNFYEQNTSRIPLKIINRGWFLDNFSEGDKAYLDTTKRFIDIIFSLIFGLISLFLMPFILLGIILDSKGEIIFNQKRVTKDGKSFTALKFRTMYRNAEKSGAVWASEDDPRITKLGKFLRKTRLDEIPQLWNILKGEMSFVGPRPERPEFIEQLINEIPFYRERLLVKPGLTGWAQINFPYASSVEDSLKKLQYDLYYIKHRSLLLDLSIILKTINIIFKGGGR